MSGMAILSFIGIILALVVIIVGSVRGYSLILVSTIAALVWSLLGAFASVSIDGGSFWKVFYDDYAVSYMKGVADIIIQMFPLFLAGNMFGKMLEMTGLPLAIADAVFARFGEKGVVSAVFFATFILSVAGINVFVIIFTMFPLASAFYKKAGLPRSMIPINILAAAVAEQCLPGVPTFNLIIPAQALGVNPASGFVMGIVTTIFVGGFNWLYLQHASKKFLKAGVGYGEETEEEKRRVSTINEADLPNPLLFLVPLAVVIVLMNVVNVPAWAALFVGCVVIFIMFYKRLGGFAKALSYLAEAAENSQVVMSTGAICGIAALISAVPGYQVVVGFLESVGSGNPYVLCAVAVALLAGFGGSSLGGIQFVLANYVDKLLAMGASPIALTRIIAVSCLTLDSLPHNSANIITFQACGVEFKEGYYHFVLCTIISTTLATIITVVMSTLGIY